jgi:uncharacterized membrane protein YpjA
LRLDALLDRLDVFARKPYLAWPLILGNLVAVWYGWTIYYAAQLTATPWYSWPFVPDSPNAVLLFALALALRQARLRWAWLDLVAWLANVKVGLWTIFVLLYYFEAFFRDEPVLRWILFWLHVGMVAQAWVLHRDLRRAPPHGLSYLVVGAVFLVGDALDYGPLLLHPHLRGPAHPVVSTTTVLLTLLSIAWALAWYGARRGALRTSRSPDAPETIR